MALSNAERQRRYRQRLKERAATSQQSLRDAVTQYVQAYWDEHGHGLEGVDSVSPEDDVETIMNDISERVEIWLSNSGLTIDESDKEAMAVVVMARRFVT